MITLRILLSPGRRGRIVDASGRSLPQPVPAPVIGSAEPLRIILLDPSSLDPADPYGFDTGAPLRLTISGDWDPATIPVYATNALVRYAVGTYDLADPSGTRTAEALALLGVLAERLCAWELCAYGGDPSTEADWAHPLSVVQFDAPLRQRADSLGGDPAEAPAVDLRGPAGDAATVAVGATTTLPAGSPATVENVGTPSAAVLNFGIPGGSGAPAFVDNPPPESPDGNAHYGIDANTVYAIDRNTAQDVFLDISDGATAAPASLVWVHNATQAAITCFWSNGPENGTEIPAGKVLAALMLPAPYGGRIGFFSHFVPFWQINDAE